jgi:TRAP-type mannitol/chloroaromatic compound transport system substrate-binding protein
LHEVAKNYYYPGWHEPGPTLELIFNKFSFEALPEDLQAIVTYASRAANQEMLDEFTARNNAALQQLVDKHGVVLRKFPDDVLRALYQGTQEAVARLVAEDEMAAKTYASWSDFYLKVRDYHHISEQAYINARDMVLTEE